MPRALPPSERRRRSSPPGRPRSGAGPLHALFRPRAPSSSAAVRRRPGAVWSARPAATPAGETAGSDSGVRVADPSGGSCGGSASPGSRCPPGRRPAPGRPCVQRAAVAGTSCAGAAPLCPSARSRRRRGPRLSPRRTPCRRPRPAPAGPDGRPDPHLGAPAPRAGEADPSRGAPVAGVRPRPPRPARTVRAGPYRRPPRGRRPMRWQRSWRCPSPPQRRESVSRQRVSGGSRPGAWSWAPLHRRERVRTPPAERPAMTPPVVRSPTMPTARWRPPSPPGPPAPPPPGRPAPSPGGRRVLRTAPALWCPVPDRTVRCRPPPSPGARAMSCDHRGADRRVAGIMDGICG